MLIKLKNHELKYQTLAGINAEELADRVGGVEAIVSDQLVLIRIKRHNGRCKRTVVGVVGYFDGADIIAGEHWVAVIRAVRDDQMKRNFREEKHGFGMKTRVPEPPTHS